MAADARRRVSESAVFNISNTSLRDLFNRNGSSTNIRPRGRSSFMWTKIKDKYGPKPSFMNDLALATRRRSKTSYVDNNISKSILEIQDNFVQNKRPALTRLFVSLVQNKGSPSKLRHMCEQMFDENLPSVLVQALEIVNFEEKKEVVNLFILLVQSGSSESNIRTQDYFRDNGRFMIETLLVYCGNEDLVLHSGMMMRACLVQSDIFGMVLAQFEEFLQRLELNLKSSLFDVSTDAFLTLSTLLLQGPTSAQGFLSVKYDVIVKLFERLVQSDVYVTQRQALNLLHEVLFLPGNYQFMNQFTENKENLVFIMKTMASKSVNIRCNAYHVFKVFVAKPNKNEYIKKILYANKEKLLRFVSSHIQFEETKLQEEKAMVLSTLIEIQVA